MSVLREAEAKIINGKVESNHMQVPPSFFLLLPSANFFLTLFVNLTYLPFLCVPFPPLLRTLPEGIDDFNISKQLIPSSELPIHHFIHLGFIHLPPWLHFSVLSPQPFMKSGCELSAHVLGQKYLNLLALMDTLASEEGAKDQSLKKDFHLITRKVNKALY